MGQTQTANDPMTYPERIYNGNGFDANVNREQSSDNLTTVLTNRNEVLGFPDQTSKQEMQAAIEADRNGAISTYKPSFYEKFIRQPLQNLGISAFQPTFVTDIKPTPERAFATAMAEAATAGVFKPESVEKEAKANPILAFAGSVVGSIAAFASGSALLNGWKLAQLTPFAESIIKGGILGGAYKGVSETSNELRDQDHPDLAKIGKAVLHDTLWWGGISGVTGAVTKPVGVAASTGLGYLMAKSDGADEPTALLNGAVLGGFHLLQTHGDQPEVRQLITEKVQSNIADYILAKNPLVHPEVAAQAGREFVASHAEEVIEKSNQAILGKGQQEAKGVGEILIDSANEMERFNKEQENKEAMFGVPGKYDDGYDPKLMNYLAQYIPADRIVRMSGTDRTALGNSPVKDLEGYRDQYQQMTQLQASEKAEANKPVEPDIDRMINEGGKIDALKEATKSKIILNQVMKNITVQVTKPEGEKTLKSGEVKPQGEINAESGRGSAQEGSGEKASERETQAGVHLRDNEEGRVDAKQEEVTKESGIAKSLRAKAIEKGLTEDFSEIAEFTPATIKDQSEKFAKIMDEDIDKAKRIATGKEKLPEGLNGITAWKAMEEYALDHNDGKLALELANSPIAENVSKAAQEVSLTRGRVPDSATRHMQELKKLREKAAEDNLKGEKPNTVKQEILKSAKEKIAKNKPTKKNWVSFLEEIKC